jgi:hypothetical protein
MKWTSCIPVLLLLSLPAAGVAQTDAPAPDPVAPAKPELSKSEPGKPESNSAPSSQVSDSICLMIESAAKDHSLPFEFFARVIWQESRFRPEVVGPRTRSGDHALGIAQFMPRTAMERGLLDPFDPVQALPKSAEFLSELRGEFGNLGLAAAAYNAGPQRLRDYLAGRGALPAETRAYVAAITGSPVDDWVNARGAAAPPPSPATDCRQLAALLKQSPNPFVRELEQRVATVAAAPWGVQLSAGFSRALALRSYAAIARRYEAVLRGHDPTIFSTRLLTRGTRPFYQVRVGANTREAAQGLCARIQKVGGACMVLHNRRA